MIEIHCDSYADLREQDALCERLELRLDALNLMIRMELKLVGKGR